MTDAVPSAENFDENSVPGLWEAARYLLCWLYAVCGGPCDLVAEPWLTAKERRHIAFWLRPVEALVRRLLVVEAARIAQDRPQAKKGAGPKAGRPAIPPRRGVSFPDPGESTGWSVRFSMFEPSLRARNPFPVNRFPPQVRSLDTQADILAPAALAFAAAQHRQRHAQGGDEPSFPQIGPARLKPSRRAGNPWPLARRIEALIRVVANPEPYARRLARRLRKDPARLVRACRPPPPRPPGGRPAYGDEPVRRAGEHALRALAAFDTG